MIYYISILQFNSPGGCVHNVYEMLENNYSNTNNNNIQDTYDQDEVDKFINAQEMSVIPY
jgi:hypothetical protein